jgi:hypothetical protein
MRDYAKEIQDEIKFLKKLSKSIKDPVISNILITDRIKHLHKIIEQNVNEFVYNDVVAEYYYSPHDSYYWGRFYHNDIPLVFKGRTLTEAEFYFHKMVDEIGVPQ